jgi:hypothetical protein
MVLTTGILEDVRAQVKAYLATRFLYCAVGDDATAPTPADTVLGGETFRDAADAVDSTTYADKIIFSLIVQSAENNGEDVKEAGWFDATPAGDMQVRFLLNTISKTSDITLYIDTSVEIVVEEV